MSTVAPNGRVDVTAMLGGAVVLAVLAAYQWATGQFGGAILLGLGSVLCTLFGVLVSRSSDHRKD